MLEAVVVFSCVALFAAVVVWLAVRFPDRRELERERAYRRALQETLARTQAQLEQGQQRVFSTFSVGPVLTSEWTTESAKKYYEQGES